LCAVRYPGYGLGNITPESSIEHRPGVGCVVRRAGAQAGMLFMGETIRVPARAEPALRFIAANREFQASDLPGKFSDDSRVTLVRRFVREGLLQIAEVP